MSFVDVLSACLGIMAVPRLSSFVLEHAAFGPLIETSASFVHSAFPDVAEASGCDSVKADGVCWFLTPSRQVVEWVLFNIITLALLWRFSRDPWSVDVPALRARRAGEKSSGAWTNEAEETREAAITARARAKADGWLRPLDHLLSALSWVTIASTCYYKLSKGKGAFLLQPCHLINFFVCALTLLGAEAGSSLFNFVLCTFYGLIIALAAPDTTSLKPESGGLPGELEMFYVYHVMLLIIPIVWVARRRFSLYSGVRPILTTWAISFLLHLNVFLPVALYTGAHSPTRAPCADTHEAARRTLSYNDTPPHHPLRSAPPPPSQPCRVECKLHDKAACDTRRLCAECVGAAELPLLYGFFLHYSRLCDARVFRVNCARVGSPPRCAGRSCSAQGLCAPRATLALALTDRQAHRGPAQVTARTRVVAGIQGTDACKSDDAARADTREGADAACTDAREGADAACTDARQSTDAACTDASQGADARQGVPRADPAARRTHGHSQHWTAGFLLDAGSVAAWARSVARQCACENACDESRACNQRREERQPRPSDSFLTRKDSRTRLEG